MIRDPDKYNEYDLVKEIDTENLVSFLDESMRKRGFFSISYFLILYALVGILLAQLFVLSSISNSLSNGIIQISSGVLLGLLSVIPHELIHALTYRFYGARNIQFHSNWRKLYFTTAVHRYVLSKYEFIVLALMPFVVIFLLGFLIIFITQFDKVIIPFLIIHTSMCKGDFALINFLNKNIPNIEYVFTDLDAKKYSFLGQKNQLSLGTR